MSDRFPRFKHSETCTHRYVQMVYDVDGLVVTRAGLMCYGCKRQVMVDAPGGVLEGVAIDIRGLNVYCTTVADDFKVEFHVDGDEKP